MKEIGIYLIDLIINMKFKTSIISDKYKDKNNSKITI
jgi:hypothetical protein